MVVSAVADAAPTTIPPRSARRPVSIVMIRCAFSIPASSTFFMRSLKSPIIPLNSFRFAAILVSPLLIVPIANLPTTANTTIRAATAAEIISIPFKAPTSVIPLVMSNAPPTAATRTPSPTENARILSVGTFLISLSAIEKAIMTTARPPRRINV